MNGWIDSANGWAATWAPVLWRASWQGGLFIAIVWAVCKLFPRIPVSSRHWLWWLASAQLLIRLLIASPIALPVLPAEILATPGPAVYAEVPQVPTIVTSTKTVSAPSYAEVKSKAPTPSRPFALLIAMSVWLVGLALCFANAIKRVFKTRALVQGKSLFDNDALTDMVEEMSREIGVAPPQVRESRKAPCPLLVGWLRPTIVLPVGAVTAFTESELRMAIAHELTHLKRKDLWLSLVTDSTQVLFWFHPLAWLAANETAAAREEACDAEALRLSGGSLAAYARLLFNSAQSSSSAAVMGAAFGYRLIQRRINMLKSSTSGYGVHARRATSVLIAIGAICALPWTVTAQSPATTTLTAKKKIAIHKTVKKAVKAKTKHLAVVSHRASSTLSAPSKARALAAVVSTQVGISRPAMVIMTTGTSGSAAVVARSGATAKTAAYATTAAAKQSNLHTTPAIATSSVAATEAPAKTSNLPSPAQAEAVSTTAPTSARILGDGYVEIVLDKCDIRQAIRMLGEKAGLDYMIRSDVRDDVVTLSLHHAPAYEVLHAILNAVKQKLTYTVENNVYHVVPKD